MTQIELFKSFMDTFSPIAFRVTSGGQVAQSAGWPASKWSAANREDYVKVSENHQPKEESK